MELETHPNPPFRPVRRTWLVYRICEALLAYGGPMYGHQIRVAIGGGSAGAVYPALRRLQAAGWLTSDEETTQATTLGRPRRRYYWFTHQGRRAAVALINAMQPTP